MPFNRKNHPKISDIAIEEPQKTIFDTMEPRPAPVGVRTVEILNTGVEITQLANGFMFRRDCQHWVTNFSNHNCRYDCPTEEVAS